MNDGGKLLSGPEGAAVIRADLDPRAERDAWGEVIIRDGKPMPIAPMISPGDFKDFMVDGEMPLVGKFVCITGGSAGVPRSGEVRRDVHGRDWLAVVSWRWRVGMVKRAPAGRSHPDMWDVIDVADSDEDVRTWCYRCDSWHRIDMDDTRRRLRAATPTHPARILLRDVGAVL